MKQHKRTSYAQCVCAEQSRYTEIGVLLNSRIFKLGAGEAPMYGDGRFFTILLLKLMTFELSVQVLQVIINIFNCLLMNSEIITYSYEFLS